MTISNPKFGAELITQKGRIQKYDAAECVVNQLAEEEIEHSGIYGIAYDLPKQLKPVDSLHFVISKDYRSPMGANLAAFYDKNELPEKLQSEVLSWKELRKKLNQ
jgi:copper chaperone NosL